MKKGSTKKGSTKEVIIAIIGLIGVVSGALIGKLQCQKEKGVDKFEITRSESIRSFKLEKDGCGAIKIEGTMGDRSLNHSQHLILLKQEFSFYYAPIPFEIFNTEEKWSINTKFCESNDFEIVVGIASDFFLAGFQKRMERE